MTKFYSKDTQTGIVLKRIGRPIKHAEVLTYKKPSTLVYSWQVYDLVSHKHILSLGVYGKRMDKAVLELHAQTITDTDWARYQGKATGDGYGYSMPCAAISDALYNAGYRRKDRDESNSICTSMNSIEDILFEVAKSFECDACIVVCVANY